MQMPPGHTQCQYISNIVYVFQYSRKSLGSSFLLIFPAASLFLSLPPTSHDTHLTLHGIRIQLTHITAAILLRDGLDVQIPCILIEMTDRDTRIVCDDVLVYGLNGLGIRLKPAHL